MKEINKNNYELFALDYIEGNLKDDIKIKFEEFISKNPQILEDINGFENITVNSKLPNLKNKFDLKKSPIDGLSYFEYLAISDIEKTITPKEKNELETILKQNSEKFYEYQLFTNSVLISEKIVFPNKAKIKKSKIISLYNVKIAISSIAAMFIIFIGFKFIQNSENFFGKNSNSKLIENSFAYSAVNSINNITIREVSPKYLKNKDNKTPDISNPINNQNELNINKEIIAQNNDTTDETNTGNNSISPRIELPLNQIKLSLNQKELPTIYHSLGTTTPLQKNKITFNSLRKKINAVSVVNFALKSFDAMTESEYNMKIDVDKDKRSIKFDIKQKTFAVAFK